MENVTLGKKGRFLVACSTLILAFCSIVYELVLGQALSAFLGDTVLRYSVTIGLYLFSMGVGAYWAEDESVEQSKRVLIRIELYLSLIGGSLLFLLHAFHAVSGIGFGFSLFAHSLIVLVGVLTGFELPLLMRIWGANTDSDGIAVLALNYLGALLGPIVFALYFYPVAGIVWTCFLVGALNAVTGTIFLLAWPEERQALSSIEKGMLPLLVLVFAFLAHQHYAVMEFFQRWYLLH